MVQDALLQFSTVLTELAGLVDLLIKTGVEDKAKIAEIQAKYDEAISRVDQLVSADAEASATASGLLNALSALRDTAAAAVPPAV
jgi:hypothetical protein